MDVETLRSEFPALERTIYLNSGWQGPPPRRVTEAIQERLRMEAESGPTSKPMYEQAVETRLRAREVAARLLNASVEEISLTPRTTDGLTTVVSGLRWQEGDEVITFDIEHPSVLIPCHLLERKYGVTVRCLPLAPDEDHWSILEKVRSALNENTRLVFFSHIQFLSGLRMPVEEIRAMTRPLGVQMLVDGAQTAGHIDLDMRALDCDYYAIPGQKWLSGPSGTGALFVRRDRIADIELNQVGFRSVANMMELRPTFHEYRIDDENIEKFGGDPPSIALTLGFIEAAELALEVGTAAIEERSIALASRAKDLLVETPGVTLRSPTARAGSSGLVSFAVEGVEPEMIVDRLWDEDSVVIRAVHNPDGVRLSFAWFNTDDEVDRVLEAIRKIGAG